MPIKDLAKRREYQRNLMAKKRQGLTENNVSPKKIMLDPVRPCSRCEELQEIATNWYWYFVEQEEKNKRLTKEINRLTTKINSYEKH